MTHEPLADVRDMYLAHVMFRREIGLAPALIRGVADGDVERAAVVADHVRLVDTVLHHHHEAEDEHLWHRLVERAGADAEPVVRTMTDQHGAIDELLDEVRAELTSWRDSADPVRGEALAKTVTLLHERLVEHLAVEEEQALPLIEKHITAAEWGQMIAAGAADVAPEQMPLIFGLMAYEGEPGTVRDVIASMPPEVSSVIGDLAAQAFAAHAERVHGTATPERIGAAR
ncbi:hemerythrin domain-containing protein [Amycolatopsis sp., V23-08]|uniref:Hemerythrin domain-containing protein n=1 Tax=Amycolatopsis heterodermiae TaxID=3110235 RepID=A0ABU5R2W1_9PSEU|nr:hemerythrin domain-containing protein [Amycolatopsis sp., V23-08]MEA5360540.1 hemerythrin domain-containing protein [Amycolatopsis sp., V23-08]